MSSYYTVDENRIRQLREVADKLGCMQELQALCMLYVLRTMQESDEDLLRDGGIDGPEFLPNKQDCEDRAAMFLEDMICESELMEVAKSNNLGDYSITAVPVVEYKIIKKI